MTGACYAAPTVEDETYEDFVAEFIQECAKHSNITVTSAFTAKHVTDTIDELVEELTGDWERSWVKSHG